MTRPLRAKCSKHFELKSIRVAAIDTYASENVDTGLLENEVYPCSICSHTMLGDEYRYWNSQFLLQISIHMWTIYYFSKAEIMSYIILFIICVSYNKNVIMNNQLKKSVKVSVKLLMKSGTLLVDYFSISMIARIIWCKHYSTDTDCKNQNNTGI